MSTRCEVAFVLFFSTILLVTAIVDHAGPITDAPGENLVMGLFGLAGVSAAWFSIWRGE